jgi:hypothetical protein
MGQEPIEVTLVAPRRLDLTPTQPPLTFVGGEPGRLAPTPAAALEDPQRALEERYHR